MLAKRQVLSILIELGWMVRVVRPAMVSYIIYNVHNNINDIISSFFYASLTSLRVIQRLLISLGSRLQQSGMYICVPFIIYIS